MEWKYMQQDTTKTSSHGLFVFQEIFVSSIQTFKLNVSLFSQHQQSFVEISTLSTNFTI